MVTLWLDLSQLEMISIYYNHILRKEPTQQIGRSPSTANDTQVWHCFPWPETSHVCWRMLQPCLTNLHIEINDSIFSLPVSDWCIVIFPSNSQAVLIRNTLFQSKHSAPMSVLVLKWDSFVQHITILKQLTNTSLFFFLFYFFIVAQHLTVVLREHQDSNKGLLGGRTMQSMHKYHSAIVFPAHHLDLSFPITFPWWTKHVCKCLILQQHMLNAICSIAAFLLSLLDPTMKQWKQTKPLEMQQQ